MEELREFLDKYNVEYTVEGDYIIAGDINLYSKEISKLPESIGNIKCNVLDLCYNKIEELPESIGNIKCNELYLQYNQISKLPELIGNIKCNSLCLNNNKISEIPESIGNLRCNGLCFDNNQISVLPESIGNLKCNTLDLYNNKLKELPESIGNLKCESLYLQCNQISVLPESISNIKCNNLNLFGNNLSEKPLYDKYKFNDIEITNDYINCDGLFSWFNSIKTINEYIVYICYNNYIVTKDNTIFSHGKSIRQAISDLIFKLSDRDKSHYIGLDKGTELSIEQAIVMYRIITGACSSGVEGFLYGKDIPETVSVNYILGILRENDYGYKEFVKFFNLK